MDKKLMVLAAGFVLLISGCSLAPEYQRPQALIPESWPQGNAYASAQENSALPQAQDLQWEEFFTDAQLRTVIDMALDNNLDLQAAALYIERDLALYGVQRAELFPALNAAGSGGTQRRSADLIGPGEPRTVEQYSVDFGIASWEIDFFGRIRSLKDQALENYLATEQAQKSVRVTLIANVAKTYFTLAADKADLELARQTLVSQQDTRDLIQKSYRIGLATEIDLQRVLTQVEGARRNVARGKQLVAQDRNALHLLVGTEVPSGLLPDDLKSISAPLAVQAGLASDTLLNRPDILAEENKLKAANATIGAARAAFFPRISLTTAIGTASTDLSGLFASDTDTWSFAPQISMPIFDARIWRALEVSKADQEIMLNQYNRAIQTAFREVADALAVQGTIDDQVAAQEALVDAAEATYGLSNMRYQKGIGTYLSVLDAHRSLYAQQQVLTTYHLSRLASRVDLFSALGGGAS